jgi:hypothetical protein
MFCAMTQKPVFIFSHPATLFLSDDSHVANWSYCSLMWCQYLTTNIVTGARFLHGNLTTANCDCVYIQIMVLSYHGRRKCNSFNAHVYITCSGSWRNPKWPMSQQSRYWWCLLTGHYFLILDLLHCLPVFKPPRFQGWLFRWSTDRG